MLNFLATGFTFFCLFAFGLVALLAERHYRQVPVLPTNGRGPSTSSVDIILPARNEAANITRVTASLMALHYPNFRVLVVDDHSDDATAQLAHIQGAEILQLTSEPPAGWTGKCHACEQGARMAQAEWLLFTDADTFHQPDSLAHAVNFAEGSRFDAISLLLRQECDSFSERVILPVAYHDFFAVLPMGRPPFNGQYILIRRAVYERSGGFAKVRGRVMEDVALADSLAQQGFRIGLLNGHDEASVRMYHNFPALLQGMIKTSFAAAHDRGALGWFLTGITFLGLFVLLMILVGLLFGSVAAFFGGLLVVLTEAFLLTPWMRRFGVRPAPVYALFGLVGIAVLWLTGMLSTFQAISGRGVRWKGRRIVESIR